MTAPRIGPHDVVAAVAQAAVIHGAADRYVSGVATVSAATPSDLTFCAPERSDALALLESTKAGIVLVSSALDPSTLPPDKTCILMEDPRRGCMRVLARFFTPPPASGVHPMAMVDASAWLGERVYVGPFASIGPGVSIGDESVIHAGVHIYGPAQLGRRCIVHAGAVLGADGFGFWRGEDGRLEKFPHIGGVHIGDEVEIGALTAVDRGTLGDTRIGNRTKVDNLVHIAHNVDIGEDCTIIAHAMLGGSVRIGDRTWIAPSACLRDRIAVGHDAVVGLGSVVTKSVEAGQTVLGVPARPKA